VSQLSVATQASPAGLSAEEAEFVGVVRDLSQDQFAPHHAAIDRSGRIPPEVLAAVDHQELHTVMVSEARGGAGARPLLGLLVVEQLAEACPVVGVLVGEGQTASVGLEHAGISTAAGGTLALADGRANVQLDRAGESVILRGTAAQALSFGEDPAVIVLGSSQDGSLGVLLRAGDYVAGPPIRRTGLRGMQTASLEVDGLAAATAALLPPASVQALRVHRLLAHSAVAIGVARKSLGMTLAYVRERHQFGHPIGDFGAVERMVSDMTAAVATAASLLHDLAARDTVSHAAAVRTARVATTAALRVADDAIQLHGGYGCTQEYGLERLFRDALTLRAVATGWSGSRSGHPAPGAEVATPGRERAG
jgi:alkylation response protein AidB-like acyl-CoA dehydrogenase